MGPGGGAFSQRVAYASALGCRLDVDFATGRTPTGAPATDNTGPLNAFLATASAKHPVKLVLDGPALVRGLVIAADGHTTIEGLGWGTGLYIADAANADAIRIGTYTGGQTEGQGVRPIPPRVAASIVLRDFAVFGNGQRCATGSRAGTTPPDQPVRGAPQHAVFGVALTGCQNVLLDHLRFVNAACYAVVIANANDIIVRACSFESSGLYQDGVHIDGPAERVVISSCSFATGDDAIALNAPEGFGGDIEDVHISDCISKGSYTMMRVYTSVQRLGTVYRVRRVLVSGCTGSTFNGSFNLGIEGNKADPAPDQIEDIQISGCSFSAPGFANLLTPMGLLTVRDCVCRSPIRPTPEIIVQAPARQVVLDGFTILRTPQGNANASFLEIAPPGSVGRLVLRGLRVVDEDGPYPPLPYVLSVSSRVEEVQVDSAEMPSITSLITPASWAGIGRIGGAGLLGTGCFVPEDKVAENTLFLSSPNGDLVFRAKRGTRRLG